MAQGVWADVGVGELRIANLGLVLADDPRDAATAELGSWPTYRCTRCERADLTAQKGRLDLTEQPAG